MQILESAVETAVVKYAISKRVIAIKLVSGSVRGWPDRLFLLPGGVPFFIEFKKPGEKPRKLQEYRLWLLRRQGCVVYVCDNVEKGKEIIDGMAATFVPRKGDLFVAFPRGSWPTIGSGLGEDFYRPSGVPTPEGTGVREEDAGDSATEADGAYVAQ